jgi:hypothetical protein
VVYGTPYQLPEANEAAGESAGASTGTLTLTMVDQNKLNPSGIPVNLSGAVVGVHKSDDRGKLSFKAKPGQYSAQALVGCSGPLIVDYGGGGSGYLVAGQAVSGTIPVAWRHAIAPADAASPSAGPNWPIGETIDIVFDVYDRCRNDFARSATFSTWAFRTSSNLEVIGSPSMRSDERAKSLVRVRCNSSGEPTLIAYDTKNRLDEVDMIKALLMEGKFMCGGQ